MSTLRRRKIIIPPLNLNEETKESPRLRTMECEEIIQPGSLVLTPHTPPCDESPRDILNDKISKIIEKKLTIVNNNNEYIRQPNMYTDSTLLHTFIALKSQLDKEPTNEIEELLSIDNIRDLAIREMRIDLVTQLLSLEWEEILPEPNNDKSIKTIVNNYMKNKLTPEEFRILYNIMQIKMRKAEDILYYLNPLKFPEHEAIALNEMIVDPTLDYSGFISACKVRRIDDTHLHIFIKRLGSNSYTRKYEKIMTRRRKSRDSS